MDIFQGIIIGIVQGLTEFLPVSSSAHLVRYKNIDELLKNKKIALSIDFKPALSEEKLDDRIKRDYVK